MERWSDVRISYDYDNISHGIYKCMTWFHILCKKLNCFAFNTDKWMRVANGGFFIRVYMFSANHRREFQTISFHNAFNLICSNFRHHCFVYLPTPTLPTLCLTLEPSTVWVGAIVMNFENMSKWNIHIRSDNHTFFIALLVDGTAKICLYTKLVIYARRHIIYDGPYKKSTTLSV